MAGFETFQKSGRHRWSWTGKDRRGHRVASGVYFLRLREGGQELTQKVVLAR